MDYSCMGRRAGHNWVIFTFTLAADWVKLWMDKYVGVSVSPHQLQFWSGLDDWIGAEILFACLSLSLCGRFLCLWVLYQLWLICYWHHCRILGLSGFLPLFQDQLSFNLVFSAEQLCSWLLSLAQQLLFFEPGKRDRQRSLCLSLLVADNFSFSSCSPLFHGGSRNIYCLPFCGRWLLLNLISETGMRPVFMIVPQWYQLVPTCMSSLPRVVFLGLLFFF